MYHLKINQRIFHQTASKDSAVASASDSISPVPSDGRHQTSPNLFSAIENNNKDDGSSSEDSSSVARSPNLSSFFNGYSMGSSMMSENSSVDEIEATNPLTDTGMSNCGFVLNCFESPLHLFSVLNYSQSVLLKCLK